MDSKDISCIDKAMEFGVKMLSYTKECLMTCDVVYIDYDSRLQDIAIYKQVMSDILDMNKEVILSHDLRIKLEIGPVPVSDTASYWDSLINIPVPVIMVYTQGEHTDQLACELGIRKCFSEAGYKLSQVGSTNAGQFFGFHPVPDLLYTQLEPSEKILSLNYYINNLVSTEKPELLIMGVPNAIMKYDNRILQGMGVLPFIISSAVLGDISVLSINYSDNTKKNYDEINALFKYRFGSPVNFFCMSNVHTSPDDRSGRRRLAYLDIDIDAVTKKINEQVEFDDYHLFNALTEESMMEACRAIQIALVDNVRSF